MGAIMREGDEILFIWCSATCIISTLSPSLTYYVQRYATQTQVLAPFFLVTITQLMMNVTLQGRI